MSVHRLNILDSSGHSEFAFATTPDEVQPGIMPVEEAERLFNLKTQGEHYSAFEDKPGGERLPAFNPEKDAILFRQLQGG